MKSRILFTILLLPLLAMAQEKKPLSSQVQELLDKKQAKLAGEQALVEEIGKEAVFEVLRNEQQKKTDELKKKNLKKEVSRRFVPKTPFLNFRPLPNSYLWKSSLHYAYNDFDTNDGVTKKEFSRSHLFFVNQLQYSWDKRWAYKYINTFNFYETTTNDKRVVSGATITPDPDITNNDFGDHIIEVNYRSKREIFFGYDLDYFLRIVYPFGDATRAYAYGTGGESLNSLTTASNKGNLKSPSTKAILGIDYFTGKERIRYNFGGSVGFSLPGRYTIYKGRGFWSTTPDGLIVDTDSYAEANFWVNMQKRPKALQKVFYGLGVNFDFLMQQEEKFITEGAPSGPVVSGLSWNQRNRTKEHFRISTRGWIKYMLKEFEHLEASLLFHVPYSYKIKKQIIDEGADAGGNRNFVNSQFTEKVKSVGPIELSFTYVRSF